MTTTPTNRDIFKEVFRRTGWTAEELAALLGKSTRTVEGYLSTGRGVPTDDVVRQAIRLYFKRLEENLEYMAQLNALDLLK